MLPFELFPDDWSLLASELCRLLSERAREKHVGRGGGGGLLPFELLPDDWSLSASELCRLLSELAREKHVGVPSVQYALGRSLGVPV